MYTTFKFNALNRILTVTDNTGRYNVLGVSYDKNGNIITLQRQGHLNAAATLFGTMDNLTYNYQPNSNKLIKVSDTGNTTYGFKDGANQTIEYNYDANGNMISDANKGISNISYNHLNLPTSVTIANQGSIEYVYDATGVKMRKTISTGTVTDYANNFIYENGDLKFFSTPEGYVDIVTVTTNTGFPYYFPQTSKEFHYIYQYKDHLGNVRLSYKDNNGTLEIIEENNYYPFGLQHKGYNNVVNGTENNYFNFQGQEKNEELGLNWLSFKWRNHDPAIGRFMSIDPLAEKFFYNSPYAFSEK